ncbi:hypothetical protein HELRODRAFT_173726 [Helobdella robusta]|uniref:BRCT domain-containing protein n=1 Tax=Helobdella robusta TaxID=6412 RepID=T1F761_HELRO|nr:hypothetical protein HELRODRAFT_173726 [Helobdella robusta]ESO03430.1 hypothetical protein HELRODRAFT_173726 [Helobdella robusta]
MDNCENVTSESAKTPKTSNLIPDQVVSDESSPASAIPTSEILKGVTAYVDVHALKHNYSSTFATELIELGANVSKRMTPDVTHVVFKDGSRRTVKAAMRRNLPLVNTVWVDNCRKKHRREDEMLYLARIPPKKDDWPYWLRLFKRYGILQYHNKPQKPASERRYSRRRRLMDDDDDDDVGSTDRRKNGANDDEYNEEDFKKFMAKWKKIIGERKYLFSSSSEEEDDDAAAAADDDKCDEGFHKISDSFLKQSNPSSGKDGDRKEDDVYNDDEDEDGENGWKKLGKDKLSCRLFGSTSSTPNNYKNNSNRRDNINNGNMNSSSKAAVASSSSTSLNLSISQDDELYFAPLLQRCKALMKRNKKNMSMTKSLNATLNTTDIDDSIITNDVDTTTATAAAAATNPTTATTLTPPPAKFISPVKMVQGKLNFKKNGENNVTTTNTNNNDNNNNDNNNNNFNNNDNNTNKNSDSNTDKGSMISEQDANCLGIIGYILKANDDVKSISNCDAITTTATAATTAATTTSSAAAIFPSLQNLKINSEQKKQEEVDGLTVLSNEIFTDNDNRYCNINNHSTSNESIITHDSDNVSNERYDESIESTNETITPKNNESSIRQSNKRKSSAPKKFQDKKIKLDEDNYENFLDLLKENSYNESDEVNAEHLTNYTTLASSLPKHQTNFNIATSLMPRHQINFDSAGSTLPEHKTKFNLAASTMSKHQANFTAASSTLPKKHQSNLNVNTSASSNNQTNLNLKSYGALSATNNDEDDEDADDDGEDNDDDNNYNNNNNNNNNNNISVISISDDDNCDVKNVLIVNNGNSFIGSNACTGTNNKNNNNYNNNNKRNNNNKLRPSGILAGNLFLAVIALKTSEFMTRN